ncbi:rod shape-determining protein MreC [bacterium]|nr:MAG: rod shape-determining protein MreC [bacterium]
MVTLIDFIKRHSGQVMWVLALIIGVLLSQAPFTVKSAISGALMDTIYRPFDYLSGAYHTFKNRRVENLQLKEELISTRLKIETLKEIERENLRLRRALGFSQRLEYATVLAEVVGRGNPRMPGSIVVGSGAKQGVIVGLPVIDEHGVVGKVISVSDNTSVIQLITDPNLKISAVDGRSRVQGIISAASGGKLVLENVPVTADIRNGDPITASGLGGLFPKGLKIGLVSRVMVPQSGLFSKVEITPSAKLATLEEVFILFTGIAGMNTDSVAIDTISGDGR